MRDRYASLRDGLVGAWIPSISGSGLLLPDLSWQGNNGTLTNMDASDWVSGQYGRALDFDGVNDYVDVKDSAALSVDYAFTISLWAKIRSTNNMGLIGKRQANNQLNSYALFINPSGYINFTCSTTGSTTTAVQYLASGFVNIWTCFTASYDGSRMKLFADSEQIASTAFTGAIFDSPNSLKIGAINEPAAGFLDGQLDDIRIYNRALSESEIKLLASRPGIGLRPQRRSMYYAPPTGARRRRILTSMP